MELFAAPIAAPTSPWSPARRIGFRLIFSYFALFFFPFPYGLVEPEWLGGPFELVWERLVPWVGQKLFHVEAVMIESGSGDQTYHHVRVFCMAVVAVAITVVWSILDRRRRDYRTLDDWARLWLRFSLALSLLTYGVIKVVQLQFPPPAIDILNQTYGDSSPMRLLWTFMGHSAGYNLFAGGAEVLAALLLCFRRTAGIGALLASAVMAHVAVVNLCYDVPVKLESLHLLALALWLATPALQQVFTLLVLNRPTQPQAHGPYLPRPWMNWCGFGLKVAIVSAAFTTQFWDAIGERRRRANIQIEPPDGTYVVESFEEDGHEVPALATDGHRWKTFVLLNGYVRLWGFDRSTRLFKIDPNPDPKPDSSNLRFSLVTADNTGTADETGASVGDLRLILQESTGVASLTGSFEGHALALKLRRRPGSAAAETPLMRRGFHWITEVPYNQ
jgi:hypothetical protein